MFKAYILFGDPDYLKMFNDSYKAILKYVKDQDGVYVNVNMDTGFSVSSNMDGYKNNLYFESIIVLMSIIYLLICF